MHLPNNTLLQGGKYKIVRFISSGGFGCTYEAEHILLKKKVAIKEFFVKDFCNRDETTSQISVGITSKTALVSKLKSKFIAEAQSLCSLEHPNIVHVFDVFEENGTAYYVMDYIDGPSLNDMVKKDGPMSEQKAVGYIMQVADALKYVHSQNRLHLDIKPGNIMVDENDKAVLIDFGASKQYDEEGGENTSTLLGKTPGYAPLEQMGNDVVKFLPSTDIYALGATLYKLLTGNTPPSASLLASGEKLGAMPSFISEGTRNAIIKSMQTNKMNRPQSIAEFLSILAADGDDSTIVDGGGVISEEEKAPKTGAKKRKKKEPKPVPPQEEDVFEKPKDEAKGDTDEDFLKLLPKEKFGFWLKIFLLVICYCGLGSIFAPLFHWDYFDQSREVTGYGLVVFGVLQFVLALLTIHAFRKRKPDAVLLAKLSTIIICVADLLYVLTNCGGSVGIAQYQPFVTGLVTAIVWFIYLCVSKRVDAIIPSYCRKTLKRDYIIGAVFAIFAIYLFVVSQVVETVAQKETIENTNGNRVVNQTFEDSNGEEYTYTGEVRDGLPNGIGEGVYSFGRYVGPYKDGLMHGADGKFTEKGGATFVGTFDNDYYSEGRLTRSDGSYFEGIMNEGTPFQGIEYYKDGNIKKRLR